MFLRLVYFLQNIDVVCVASPETLEPSRLSSCYITGWGRRSEGKSRQVLFWIFLSCFVIVFFFLEFIIFPLCRQRAQRGAEGDLCASLGPGGLLRRTGGPVWLRLQPPRWVTMSYFFSGFIFFSYILLHYIFLFADTALCAGAEGRDACDGDGGGPLVCEQDGQWYQVCAECQTQMSAELILSKQTRTTSESCHRWLFWLVSAVGQTLFRVLQDPELVDWKFEYRVSQKKLWSSFNGL